jgi:hypothetical protein
MKANLGDGAMDIMNLNQTYRAYLVVNSNKVFKENVNYIQNAH